MARLPRYALPGQPQHVIQRGNNRSAMFIETADFERFRHDLVVACERYACAVHAYVLMTNHVHMLMTGLVRDAVAKAMQSLGRRYVAYFNRRYARTGTLWEGRYRSMPIDGERYLFTCYRYVEQNPVRAGLVPHPRCYPWSSFHANALGRTDPVVTPHEQYLALGVGELDRLAAYRRICDVPFDTPTLDHVRKAVRGDWALGDALFLERISSSTGRRAKPLKRGQRPAPPGRV